VRHCIGEALCIQLFKTEQAIVSDRIEEFGCGLRINALNTRAIIKKCVQIIAGAIIPK
jgi:hypothetical protein